ncbi:hypothetical protein F0562_034540 [Nyssa sinensis]|uniref:NAB domain-containing protein n=1 Tax=Nyssa sinensis TaxID=561372 RepID=A0A5J5AIE9_9ASTE|nr:hypothetical protein F0562_034540 [Nyssa sinensis]
MEKDSSHTLDHASSNSWWWNSHNRPHDHQSQWLQATLSELEEKTKMIVKSIEDDGDSFAKRAEMYYKKRPQLIHLVEDLHRSYRSLALNYNHLLIITSHHSKIKKEEIKENCNSLEWNQLREKVSKLMEDHLQQQAELIRRNYEKRKAIKDLHFHLYKLMDEKRALETCLSRYKLDMKQNKSHI